MTQFQINDPSIESQWRALILFGKNSATYKFEFAKSLLVLVDKETTKISLRKLSKPFSKNIIEHLKENDKQPKMVDIDVINSNFSLSDIKIK